MMTKPAGARVTSSTTVGDGRVGREVRNHAAPAQGAIAGESVSQSVRSSRDSHIRRIRKASLPRRRRRPRKGPNIRPLEQRAINNLSEMALIIRPPALRSFDRTESSARTNQSLLCPGWIPAGTQ